MSVYTTIWQPTEPRIGLQPIEDVSTTQMHPLGTIIKAKEVGTNQNGEGEFIYLKGCTSGAKGAWVTYVLDSGAAVLLAANAIGPVGIMMSIMDAATDFGWVQISGKAVGLAATGYADNGLVYATATAGTVDDAVVAGDRVKNALGASALDGPATGFAEFEIHRPFMDDATAA